MEVELPKVADEECGRFWGIQAEDRMCAGYNLAQKGICSVSTLHTQSIIYLFLGLCRWGYVAGVMML